MEKKAKYDVLVQKARAYQKHAESLLTEHPELSEILDLERWLQAMPDKDFGVGLEEMRSAAAKKPEDGKSLYTIMHSLRPSVLLAAMDDERMGPIMKEAYEVAGLGNELDTGLLAFDRIAGIERPMPRQMTFTEFRTELEFREAIYLTTRRKIESTLSTPIGDSMREFMFAEMQKTVLVPYLKFYYGSFFDEDVWASANEYINAFKEFTKTHPEIKLPKDSMVELAKIRNFPLPIPIK